MRPSISSERSSPERHLLAFAVLLLLTGCASLSPRFSPEVANAFAHTEMRKMESPSVELYYPAGERAAAVRTVSRLEVCLERLRKLPINHRQRSPALIYLTTADFNNAYVSPQTLGTEQHMLLPHHLTLDLFNWFELGLTDVGDVACHEAVHYIQMQQIDGFWNFLNIAGGNLYTPNTGMETWFLEGLATYYEGRLGGPSGRTHNPIWRGLFLAGVASRGGTLGAGDLSPEHREMLPFGGNYLTGMHFVEYLADRYGEQNLWKLVDLQANSIFSPFGVTLRFKAIYGKSLGPLLDDFQAELRAELKKSPRARPPGQQVLDPQLGYLARIAGSRADGAIASLSAGVDEVVTLKVREADGRLRFSRSFTPLLFFRPFITGHPAQASGLSFSPDGSTLFVVLADVAEDGADTSRLLQLDARSGVLIQRWDLGAAVGGAATPDGGGYLFIDVQAQNSNLARLDLATGQRVLLTHLEETTLGSPESSPDGKRIVFARRVGEAFDLFLREESGALVPLTHDPEFDYFPHWLDDHRLTFLREVNGRMQVHVMDLADRTPRQVTEAPFIAFDPVPLPDGRVAFLNREGWSWTLDAAPLPASVAQAAAEHASPSRLGEEPEPGASAPAPQPEPQVQAAAKLPDGVRDTAYSPIDRLFVPGLHVPWGLPELAVTAADKLVLGAQFGASLEGSDRLGLHTYAINLSYDTLARGPSISVGYGNYQLAPWFLSVTAGRSALIGTVELDAAVSASRPFWTTPVSFGLQALQRYAGASQIRLVGPSISANYFATEGTPYGGVKRGLGVSLAATAYPRAVGSQLDMADVSGQVTTYVPLPGRHTLQLFARGHVLPGAPAGLLQVGGVPRGILLGTWHSQPGHDDGPNLLLPLGVSFVEPLRGYEDHAVRATHAAIASARYRFPIILDKGVSSVFYILPSLFIPQVDLEAFAQGAYTDTPSNPLHRAVGGAVFIRTVWGSFLPITLYYQYAQRFDDGLHGFHLFGFAFE